MQNGATTVATVIAAAAVHYPAAARTKTSSILVHYLIIGAIEWHITLEQRL